jgi:hypothetical protein
MITLEGRPLPEVIEVQNVAEAWSEAFQYHYLYRPCVPKMNVKRALRRSAVRHISVEEYIKGKMDGQERR